MWGWPSTRRPQRHKSTAGQDAGRVIRQRRRYDCAIERARNRSPALAHLGPVEPRNIEVEAQGGCASKRDRSVRSLMVAGGIDAKETATITQNVTNWRAFCLAKLSVGVWVSVGGVRDMRGFDGCETGTGDGSDGDYRPLKG